MNKYFPFIILLFFFLPYDASSQEWLIKGKVVGTDSTELTGATVAVKNGNAGTFTKSDGIFSLSVPSFPQTLTISYIGYQTVEVIVRSEKPLFIMLPRLWRELNEVVVVGFGKQKGQEVTGSIASVKGEVLTNIAQPAFQTALQGQLPGVDIKNQSGSLNAEPTIRIRGVGSVSAGNQPLLVLDGQVLSSQTNTSTYGYNTNPFIHINPADIASVEVLKDAASASIYGSRGANGVILLTTKDGQFGQPATVNLSYKAGFSEISKKWDLLNGEEYALLWNQANTNTGSNSPFYTENAQPYTNWQDLLLRKGFVQEANASVSGATPTTRYFISGSIRDEDGYLRTTSLKRYSVRATLEQRIGEKWQARFSVNPSQVVDRHSGSQFAGSPFGATAWYVPNVDAFDANGDIRSDLLTTEIGRFSAIGNPVIYLEDGWFEQTSTQVLLQTDVSFSPIPSLQLTSAFGAQFHQLQELVRFGGNTFFGFPDGTGSASNQQVRGFTWNNYATFRPELSGPHQLELTAGTQMNGETYSWFFAEASNFGYDRLRYLSGGAQAIDPGSSNTANRFLGYFARANYGFKEKYLLTLSGRYDGSSRFGSENRYGFFPAASAGWLISEEPFFHYRPISFLKIRTSAGSTGNAEIGDFAARGLAQFGQNYNGNPGYVIQSLSNRDLGWERSFHWDVGLDVGMWNGRLNCTFDYYSKHTRDLLFSIPVAATNGVSSLFQNGGAVRNRGFEFNVNARILTGKLEWTAQVNGATLGNEVVSLSNTGDSEEQDEFVDQTIFLYRPDESVGSFYLVEYAGVDPENGDALFYDLTGNKLPNNVSPDHRKILGTSIPKFTGGFSHHFRYGNFDLSAHFYFKTGHRLFDWHGLALETNMRGTSNQLSNQLDAWTPDNTDTHVPEARLFEQNGAQISSRYLRKADFLRMRTLSIGYLIPTQNEKLPNLRVSATAHNLLTLTKYPGLDPDVEFYDAASASQGGALYNLPAAKSYLLGVEITY